MSTHIKNQRGFSALDAILMVVIAILVTAGVVYALDHRSKVATSQPSSTVTKPDTSAESAAALGQIKALYRDWLSHEGGSPRPGDIYLQKGYVTQAGANQWNEPRDYDITTCSHDPLTYDDYSFEEPTVSGNTATASIQAIYAATITLEIKLGLKKEASTWKIDSWSCPNL